VNKGIILTNEFLDAPDVMPVEGNATDYTKPSVFDIPKEVDVSATEPGEVVIRFVYPDREEASDAETPLDEDKNVLVKRGRYSGKVMALRIRDGKTVVPTLSVRLKARAPFQKRKNQQLNFLLLSNILRKKQGELQFI
jgi:hypothetical protein